MHSGRLVSVVSALYRPGWTRVFSFIFAMDCLSISPNKGLSFVSRVLAAMVKEKAPDIMIKTREHRMMGWVLMR
jgi:hypothetical protein